jgi:hypothetical protein
MKWWPLLLPLMTIPVPYVVFFLKVYRRIIVARRKAREELEKFSACDFILNNTHTEQDLSPANAIRPVLSHAHAGRMRKYIHQILLPYLTRALCGTLVTAIEGQATTRQLNFSVATWSGRSGTLMTQRRARGRNRNEDLYKLPRDVPGPRSSDHDDIDAPHVDLDAAFSEFDLAPRSYLRESCDAASASWTRLSLDWLAPLKQPWAIPLLCAAVITAVVLIVMALSIVLGALPRAPAVSQPPSSQDIQSTQSGAPETGQASPPVQASNNGSSDMRVAGTTQSSAPLKSEGKGVADRNWLVVSAQVGAEVGSIVTLNVTLALQDGGHGSQLEANVRIAIDPLSSTTCGLVYLGDNNPAIPALLSEEKTPVQVTARAESRPITILVSSTSITSQPLRCSARESGEQPSIPVTTGQSSLAGGASSILGSAAKPVAGITTKLGIRIAGISVP